MGEHLEVAARECGRSIRKDVNLQLPRDCDLYGHEFKYSDDSYIRHSYPGRAKLCSDSRLPCETDGDCLAGESCISGVDELVEQAHVRRIYGQHDPHGLLPRGADCICPDGSSCRIWSLPTGETSRR